MLIAASTAEQALAAPAEQAPAAPPKRTGEMRDAPPGTEPSGYDWDGIVAVVASCQLFSRLFQVVGGFGGAPSRSQSENTQTKRRLFFIYFAADYFILFLSLTRSGTAKREQEARDGGGSPAKKQRVELEMRLEKEKRALEARTKWFG